MLYAMDLYSLMLHKELIQLEYHPVPSLNLVDTYTNGANKVMVAYCWHAVAGYSAFGRYTCATSENQDWFFITRC